MEYIRTKSLRWHWLTFDIDENRDEIRGTNRVLGFARVTGRIFAHDGREFKHLLEPEMSPMLATGALFVIEGLPPTSHQITVAGGLASARHRIETESMFSSRSTVGVPISDTSGASTKKRNDVLDGRKKRRRCRTYSGCRAWRITRGFWSGCSGRRVHAYRGTTPYFQCLDGNNDGFVLQ